MAVTIKNPVTVMTRGGGKKYTHYITITYDYSSAEPYICASTTIQNDDATPFTLQTFIQWLQERGFNAKVKAYPCVGGLQIYQNDSAPVVSSIFVSTGGSLAFNYPGTFFVASENDPAFGDIVLES